MPFDNTPWPPTTKEIEFLKAIRDLFHDKGWCQNDYATNVNGRHAQVFSEEAANFCLVGAALHINQKQEFGYDTPGDVAARALGFADQSAAYDWNDDIKSKRSVLRRITRSIKLLQAKVMADAVK